MAMLFDIDPETARAQVVLDEAMANHAFEQAIDQARSLGGRDALRRLRDFTGRIAAVEAEILAEHVRDDGNTRDAERLLADGKTSRREQRKKARRAKAVGQNNGLADKMATGELSEEQVDVIAGASAKTDGDAARDSDLIDKIADVSPEQAQTIADDYLAARATADGVQTEHERQRALRRASTYFNKKNGLDTIGLEGDSVSSKAMWLEIEREADLSYKADGGRDLPSDKHPRTRDQRLFDAAYRLICGTARPGASPSTNQATATPDRSTVSKRHTSRAARPRIVIGLTLDGFLGRDPEAIATQVGLGLIPQTVLADYAGEADIVAALFDRNGDPLWLARLNRHASSTQFIALILRDRGCVLCGADHTRCQAHHTMPFEAPAKGRTDLDNMVLLCGPCHTRLHADHETIYQDRRRVWRTRPATPDELPADRPTSDRNQIRRE